MNQALAAVLGTPGQRTASEKLIYTDLQGEILSCMTEGGVDYSPPPFTDMYQGISEVLPDYEYFAFIPLSATTGGGPLEVSRELAMAYRPEDQEPGIRALSAAEQQKYLEVQNSCIPQEMPDYDVTDGALYVSLEELMGDVNADLAPQIDDYRECMSSAGFQFEEFSEFPGLIRSHFASPTDPSGMAFQQAAIEADDNCRANLHADAVAGLSARLAEWIDDNRVALDESRSAWHQIDVEADRRAQEFTDLAPNA